MGFFSKINDVLTGGDNPIQAEQKKNAAETVARGQEAAALKREQFDLLREDAAPMRSLRNDNIARLLRLQGIGGPQDISDFNSSPEFTRVRDAAGSVEGFAPGQDAELATRANELGAGEFENFRNRIFGTAGFSSSGLADTNRLLQSNVDAQVNLLNNAGSAAAAGLVSGAQQRGQAASAGAGLLSAFCDGRLKRNIRKVGYYASGLVRYVWDWTDEALAIVGNQPSEGPMAHDVAEVMPDNIDIVQDYLVVKDMRPVYGN
jgi:hypothetical protein